MASETFLDLLPAVYCDRPENTDIAIFVEGIRLMGEAGAESNADERNRLIARSRQALDKAKTRRG